jgi:hypothetical protein
MSYTDAKQAGDANPEKGRFLRRARRRWPVVALILAMLLALDAGRIWAQTSGPHVWQSSAALPPGRSTGDQWITPPKFHAFQLDHARLRPLLQTAPREFTPEAATLPGEIELPMPDGSLAKFRFVESPVMAPELAAKFPEIRTYLGWGVDDPAASVRFDFTPAGFHAQILSPRGAVYIDPLYRSDANLHASYFKRDYVGTDDWQCWTSAGEMTTAGARSPLDLARSGANLRTYRLAVAATGEYTAYFGGTVAAGLAAIVTAVNRATGIYETELAIRLVLVVNNNLLVYTNGQTDPYSNDKPSSLLTQNQSNLDAVIGDANYDVGHVFSTTGGGLAGLGVVCSSGLKAPRAGLRRWATRSTWITCATSWDTSSAPITPSTAPRAVATATAMPRPLTNKAAVPPSWPTQASAAATISSLARTRISIPSVLTRFSPTRPPARAATVRCPLPPGTANPPSVPARTTPFPPARRLL